MIYTDQAEISHTSDIPLRAKFGADGKAVGE